MHDPTSELIPWSVATGRHTNKAILIFRLWPGWAASVELGGPNSIKLLNKLCSIGYLPTDDFLLNQTHMEKDS